MASQFHQSCSNALIKSSSERVCPVRNTEPFASARRSGNGTFETCRRRVTMTVYGGSAEVGVRSQTDANDPKPTFRNARILLIVNASADADLDAAFATFVQRWNRFRPHVLSSRRSSCGARCTQCDTFNLQLAMDGFRRRLGESRTGFP